ncbi:hypothetical protein J7348_11030 [Qipengyuania flava]|uniref:hypothetical protein n=1 Tax=Qipengyuania flava TaxID=192812 RepID=UPI001ADD2994|nr:hypothetical protein [Qipengyuania flava]MBO9505153.1 hypothetical protein [Qipengyuania flava]
MKKTCILQTIVWIINPAGGVGKTTIAQCMQALSHMIGIDMHLASQDRGNQALKHAFPETHLIAPDALAPDAFRVVSSVENREIFVIDVGANPSGPDYDPLPFALALQAEVSQRGGKMIGVVPVTPLKINGCASALSTVRSLQNEGIEAHLVKNHQDASRRFGELELPEGVPISELKYLPSGLMSLVRNHVGSIADLCRNPDPDFTLAGGHIEQWLVDAAREPFMRTIFGNKVDDLSVDPELRPQPTLHRLDRMEHVTNAALNRGRSQLAAFSRMMKTEGDDDLLQAAKALRSVFKSSR